MKERSTSGPVSGVRMTRQRRAILAEFRGRCGHPTADEVYARVRRKLPNISLATVYRNLDILAAAGMIKKLRLGDGPRRYDGGLDRHYHVRCVRCGGIRDIPADRFGQLDRAAAVRGLRIIGHSLEFQGICGTCGRRTRGGKAAPPAAQAPGKRKGNR